MTDTLQKIASEVNDMLKSIGIRVEDDPHELSEAMEIRCEMLPRALQLKADAEYELAIARGTKAKTITGLKTASAFKEILAADTADEQRISTLADGLHSDLSRQIEAMRSRISFHKTYLEKFPDDPETIRSKGR